MSVKSMVVERADGGAARTELARQPWRAARCSRGSARIDSRQPARDRGRRGVALRRARGDRARCDGAHPRRAHVRRARVRRLDRCGRGVHAAATGTRTISRTSYGCWCAIAPSSTASRPVRRALKAPLAARSALAESQHARGQPPQHRRALRSRQRVLRDVARSVVDVLGSDFRELRRRRSRRRRQPRTSSSAASLKLSPTDQLLEIGTGWGGFALHAARNFGCRITSVTISREQHELACRRVREAGLADRVTVLLADYRELDPAVHGTFDKLVSIEMIEAVGHEYQPAYFRKCAEMLRARWRDAAPGDHDRRPAATIARADPSTSFSATSFPAAASRR